MAIDFKKVLNIAGRLTGIDQNKINSAANMAMNAGANANTLKQVEDLIKMYGMDKDFIQKTKGYMDNPLAKSIANIAGVDLNDMQHKLDVLQSGRDVSRNTPIYSNNNISTSSRIEQMKRNLKNMQK